MCLGRSANIHSAQIIKIDTIQVDFYSRRFIYIRCRTKYYNIRKNEQVIYTFILRTSKILFSRNVLILRAISASKCFHFVLCAINAINVSLCKIGCGRCPRSMQSGLPDEKQSLGGKFIPYKDIPASGQPALGISSSSFMRILYVFSIWTMSNLSRRR